MKALSVRQPWASAIALGAKRIETRSWRTDYRGQLLIHTGKHRVTGDWYHKHDSVAWCELVKQLKLPWPRGRWVDCLPYGALIAVTELVVCVTTQRILRACDAQFPELLLGDFAPGRYGWVLANVRALPEPIPWRGYQGLFEVPDCEVNA